MAQDPFFLEPGDVAQFPEQWVYGGQTGADELSVVEVGNQSEAPFAGVLDPAGKSRGVQGGRSLAWRLVHPSPVLLQGHAMQEVEVKARINGRCEEVWNLYTDHVSWQEWSKIGKVRLTCEGEPAPNGVGCVRVISNGPISVEEKVLSFDSPRRMTYTIVRGGLPIKDHLGEVLFSDEGETTLIKANMGTTAGTARCGKRQPDPCRMTAAWSRSRE